MSGLVYDAVAHALVTVPGDEVIPLPDSITPGEAECIVYYYNNDRDPDMFRATPPYLRQGVYG